MSIAIKSKLALSLDGNSLTISDLIAIVNNKKQPVLTEETRRRIANNRAALEEIIQRNIPVYGITTGFGEMVYITVDKRHEAELQENLIRSHCAGVGEAFTKKEAKAIMIARINALCKGYSGIRPELIERLLLHFNEDVIPIIPQIGSLGASGDLAPLAHMAITLIGEGCVFDKNNKSVPTTKILRTKSILPLALKFKEGLALLNGTSAMTGVGSLVVHAAESQVLQAEIITGLALEALKAASVAFHDRGHSLARPHKGQIDCATNMRTLTQGSKLLSKQESLAQQINSVHETTAPTDVYLQKAYTLRCVPQVLGAIRDTLNHVKTTLQTELNSANDNPLFFDNTVDVFHGGNFHGQPIAFAMDFLAIALTQLGVISERRTNRLLNRHLNNTMPDFLTMREPGLNCGFAGGQYPATALVAENRVICTPASIQSIPSNGDNQDVVSMGLISTRNAKKILHNNYYILAIEYLIAAQAIDIQQSQDMLSEAGHITYNLIRKEIPRLEADRYLSTDIEHVAKLLRGGSLLQSIKDKGITLR
jgi:MIO-dependent L-tyrosine 2,3-aminomutase